MRTCNSQLSVTYVFSFAYITGRVQTATLVLFFLVADMVKLRFYIPGIRIFNSHNKITITKMLNLFKYAVVLPTQLLEYSSKSNINLHIMSF